jgi:hypothetical protein
MKNGPEPVKVPGPTQKAAIFGLTPNLKKGVLHSGNAFLLRKGSSFVDSTRQKQQVNCLVAWHL